MIKELQRLAEQVDRLEDALSQAKEKTIPAQETSLNLLTEEKYINDLKEKQQNNTLFGLDRNVRQWRED